jgi:multiple sugar transport system substrate-binding protein
MVDPARQSVWDYQEFQDKISKVPGYHDTFTKTIPNTAIRFTPQPYFLQSTTEWAATLQKIVLSGTDPKQAMEALANRISRDTSKLKVE